MPKVERTNALTTMEDDKQHSQRALSKLTKKVPSNSGPLSSSDTSTRVRSPLLQEVKFRANPETTFDSLLAPHKSGKGEVLKDSKYAQKVKTPKASPNLNAKTKRLTKMPSIPLLLRRGSRTEESPLTSLIKDLRRHEWQVLSLSSTLEKERVDHKKHFDDLKAAHAKDIAIVNENHARQLMEINMRHKEDITRVKMWCEVNQPRPNELARILERQRRSALQAELRLMKEEAESRDLWNETRVQKLNRESDEVENRLAKLQRQWDDIVAWFSG
ncbi:hypothetical protein J4E82_008091 [Alternaria postmessia]|uniref:uncharacterized protein n=1 Tax=Alternaria postmessia TaxID=1187938 RepID=UPI0022251430|nr:uncharacterized protein J4E82_008091 [Alternaria postmessia]KAI5373221.1 hypothetical protein J4E82_008091 [Alternaria postmessia]